MSTTGNGSHTRSSPLSRNLYKEGQILHARDLLRESDYFLARDRQHNALAHGPGILLGLRIIAYQAGTDTKPVTETELATSGQKPVDIYITEGAAIDWFGRLIVVPKRARLRPEKAMSPSVLDPGQYRLDLVYKHKSAKRGTTGNGAGCEDTSSSSVVEESYEFELAKYDPDAKSPNPGNGPVLDGPVDDPNARAPLTLGLVEWQPTTFVGYSNVVRTTAAVLREQAPIRAHRVEAPDDTAEVVLRDALDRFAVRFAAPSDPKTPFDPGVLEDRLTLDDEGRLWVRADVSVGPRGVGFRTHEDTTTPSDWRARLVDTTNGAPFRKKADGTTPLEPNEYDPGSRELRVVFQREAGADSGTGRNRVVVGMVDPAGAFQPAVVVYDYPPVETTRGFGVVEVCGDLYVRGTTFVHSVAKLPETGDVNEQLDFILRQLAGPLAGVFRAFLSSDPDWLKQFGGVMGSRIGADPALRAQFVAALVGDPGFVAAVTQAAVAQAKADLTAEINTLKSVAGVGALLDTAVGVIDPSGLSAPLPNHAERLVAALYRTLIANPLAKKDIHDTFPAPQRAQIDTALEWLP